MASPVSSRFAQLTLLCRNTLDAVSHERLDINEERGIWEIHGKVGEFDIRMKEIYGQAGRVYAYYMLHDGEVVVGFDNYSDRRALRQKYGKDFTSYLDELIPHQHGAGKRTFELTEAKTVEWFLDTLRGLKEHIERQ